MNMIELTFEEVEQDRQASARDLEALAITISGIEAFIAADPRENRRYFTTELIRWKTMLAEAKRLDEAILKKHAELKPIAPDKGTDQ